MSSGRQEGQLCGRVAVVTGGGSGIGKAVCHALASEGASVAVVDIDGQRLEDTVNGIDEQGYGVRAIGLNLDVTCERDMQHMTCSVLDRFGALDILVNSAGILRPPGSIPKPLVQLTTSEWDAVISVNLKGTFLACRAVLPFMISRRSGDVVNISSTYGRQGRALDSVYSASKFGVIGLSEAVADEVRQYGVRVQVICPDAVNTPIWEQNGPIRPQEALDPSRVAEVIRYFVTLPSDTVIVGAVIAPFKSRRRRMNRFARSTDKDEAITSALNEQ